MTGPERTWTDRRFEAMIGNVLRAGVVLSAMVVFTGGLLYVARYGNEIPEYRVFKGEPASLRSVSGIVGDALSLDGRGLIQLGLLLLIATPIGRVMFSIVGFVRQRDWLYVAITVTVLALLGFSLFRGFA
jgi:uncharacterized membrane protein